MPEVLMPRLSDTMEEGTLSQWLKHEGDQVSKGDMLAVIETDKAAMEMEAYDEGVLSRILVEEGASVPIGTPIAVIGEQAPTDRRPPAASAAPPVTQAPPAEAPSPGQPSAAPAPGSGTATPPQPGQVRTSPLARSLARKHGIDLGDIHGTGPGGRIIRADIEGAIRRLAGAEPTAPPAPQQAAPAPARPAEFAAAGPAAPAPPRPTEQPRAASAAPSATAADAEEIPLSRVRRLTADRLATSARDAPHFYLSVVTAAEELLSFRAVANARRAMDVKISVTDLLTKACAVALAAHPEINVSWDQTRILRHRHVNIGIAVATDEGLIVPVIRDADRKTLTEIAREAHDRSTRARTRKITPDELSGGTFTISNLGMYGIRQFTAVINPPQAAILAVGAATREPVVRGDQVTSGTTMALTLSIDHRAVDGATAAAFLRDLKELIEEPLRIVV